MNFIDENKIMKRILEHIKGPNKLDLPKELSDLSEELARLNCLPEIFEMSTLAETERIQKLISIVEHYAKHMVLFNP